MDLNSFPLGDMCPCLYLYDGDSFEQLLNLHQLGGLGNVVYILTAGYLEVS